MATKADFTEEEFETLQRGVTGAGMLVSLADRDFTDSFGEAKALAKFLAEQRGNDSALMRDIADTHTSKFGLGVSPSELDEGTQKAIQDSLALLTAKAPDEIAAYKQMVSGVAEQVAGAKGGGVSAEEQAAIDKIKAALG